MALLSTVSKKNGIVAVAAGALLAGGFLTMPAAVASPPAPTMHEITICHATGSGKNPYQELLVDVAVNVSGHGAHLDDIIPPYVYNGQSFPGLNWTTGNEAIWRNHCRPVADPPVVDPPVTTPPVVVPPVVDPPATTPPVTDPPASTTPPVTTPPVVDPPVVDPPATTPPVTDPHATAPPVTDPPATTPPVTRPPVTDPPATTPPATDPPATTMAPAAATGTTKAPAQGQGAAKPAPAKSMTVSADTAAYTSPADYTVSSLLFGSGALLGAWLALTLWAKRRRGAHI